MENLSGEFLIALLVGAGCLAWSIGVLLFLGINRIIAWWKHKKRKGICHCGRELAHLARRYFHSWFGIDDGTFPDGGHLEDDLHLKPSYATESLI